jgi:hypothetical protein
MYIVELKVSNNIELYTLLDTLCTWTAHEFVSTNVWIVISVTIPIANILTKITHIGIFNYTKYSLDNKIDT